MKDVIANKKKPSELIYEIACCDDTFSKYTDTLASLDNFNKLLFIQALIDQFKSGQIYKSLNHFVDNYLDAEIEEHHWKQAFDEDPSTAQHVANMEWAANKCREMEKVEEHAKQMLETLITPINSNNAEGHCIPFRYNVDFNAFTDFKANLIRDNLIHSATSMQNLRKLFGLNKKYETIPLPTKAKHSIVWTGSNVQLSRFIFALEEKPLIKLPYHKWEIVSKCFLKENGDTFNIEQLRRPQSDRKAAIDEQMTTVIKPLLEIINRVQKKP